MPISWPRFLRRFLLFLFAALIVLDLVLAGALAYGLTKPPCIPPSSSPSDFSAPQVLQLDTFDGHSLEAWYYTSQNGAAIVAMGGIGGSLGGNLPPVEPLLRAGFGVLQITSRACAKPAAAVSLGYAEAFDAIAALDFLIEQPEVDPERVGLFGFSMGGAAAIRAAAMDERFAAVLAEGSYPNLGWHLTSAGDAESLLMSILLRTSTYLLALRIKADPWTISPIDDITEISPRPLLLVFSEASSMSGGARAQYDAAREPKELWIVPGSVHGGTHVAAPEEYEKRVVDFFTQALIPSD